MSKMKISVLVPTYNRSTVLGDAIDSIIAQGEELHELLVVDDGSKDETQKVVARYIERFGEKVRYFWKENSGKAASLNMGLAECTGTHVLVLDDDDVLTEGALRVHRSALEGRRESVFTYGRNVFFSDAGSVRESAIQKRPGAWGVDDDRLFVWALESFRFYQQATLVPMEAYREVGAFDEGLARVQDYEMMLRLCRRFEGVPVNRTVVAIRQHLGARGPAAERHSAKQMFDVWRRYDAIVLNRVQESVPLAEYLGKARAREGRPLAREEKRKAFIQRAAIMARRGIFANALEDLQMARDIMEDGENVAEDELEIMNEALGIGRYATLPPGSARFLIKCHHLYWGLGAEPAVKILRKRVYWTFYERAKGWNVKETAQLGMAFLVICARNFFFRSHSGATI